MKKILFASNKHDRLFKSLRTFACAKENELPLHRNKPEHEGICRSEEILCLLNTYETCLCSVLYARWEMFLMCFGFSHLVSSRTQPHHIVHQVWPAKCNVNLPTSWHPGKIIFIPSSCLLINQAHISKGVRLESCTASLQGVLEICRTNPPPPAFANH